MALLLIILSLIAITSTYLWLLGILIGIAYKVSQVNNRVEPNLRMQNTEMSVTKSSIIIVDRNQKETIVNYADLKEILVSVDRDEAVNVGEINFLIGNNQRIHFLSLFNNNHNVLKDDLQILAQYLSIMCE